MMERLFENRQQAGEELGRWLRLRYKDLNPLILGIPRGGVEVAYYVARELNAELSLVVAKKLPLPGHEEYGFGAIAEDGSVYVSREGSELVNPETIQHIIEQQQQEIQRRVQLYRQGKPLPDLKDRTVILVDDGIATGATLVPVIRLCRKKQASRTIIAVPVSGRRYNKHLQEADEIEVLRQPQNFYAVGQAYEIFGDFPDDQLLNLLKQYDRESKNKTGHHHT